MVTAEMRLVLARAQVDRNEAELREVLRCFDPAERVSLVMTAQRLADAACERGEFAVSLILRMGAHAIGSLGVALAEAGVTEEAVGSREPNDERANPQGASGDRT